MWLNVCLLLCVTLTDNFILVERLGFGEDIAEPPEYFEWDPSS